MFNKTKFSIYITPLFFAATLTGQTSAQNPPESNANTRDMAECSARATIIQLSIDAYSSQAWVAKVRSKQGAVDYVIEQTAGQNFREKESRVLTQRIVSYVYDVLRPSARLPNEVMAIKDAYYRQCVFDPKAEIGSLYVVDLKKAFSKNSDGQYITQNKDGSRTICIKGECKIQDSPPPHSVGKSYEDTRKIVGALGWLPAPDEMKSILIKSGRLYTNGNKTSNHEPYGNCLIENSICDKSMPELADCTEGGECTAAWSKNGVTIWYGIRNGLIVVFGSTPGKSAK